MPGRAQQMTPGQAYEMGGSRWGTIAKVLNNKKALDLAMQKHIWTMQEQAQNLAGGNVQQHIAGQYRLKEQEIQNKRYGQSNLESEAYKQAAKIVADEGLDLESPAGQARFTTIFQFLRSQSNGGQPGAESLATGQAPAVSTPQTPSVWLDESSFGKSQNSQQPSGGGKQLDPDTAKRILQKAGGDKEKARAMAKKLGYTF